MSPRGREPGNSDPENSDPGNHDPADPGLRDAARLLAAERASCAARLSGIEQELSGIIAAGADGTDDEHDPEGATIAYERQHVASLVTSAREHLAEIDTALLRLRDGSYGTCERCGQPIGTARLAARPAAATCLRCAARR